ncbi:MAG TPA: serine protease inhibitor ecotin [Flavobacteriaceae bacterium]|nr:serine protease inhibitor ecotin [Flavobacteriaceae bacterium]
MKITRLLLLAGILAFGASCASISNKNNMEKEVSSIQDLNKLAKPSHDTSMYPQARKGEERIIINLPTLKNEEDYEVELLIGRWEEVDCNHHSLMGELKKETAEGWGYDYYLFETNGNMISTRMACPDQKLEKKLINAKAKKVRYNSKLPIVVIIPEGYKVSYKLWNSLGMITVDTK